MGDQGKIHDETKFIHEGDGIYAFRPQPDRYLCFFFGGKNIIITNAFVKKSQKLPSNENQRALKAKQSYEKRLKGESYYGKKG